MSKLWLLKQTYFDIIRITAIGVLLISALIISINSFSWFSNNKTVSANNLSVSIKELDGFGLEATSYYITNITQDLTETIYTVAAANSDPDVKKIIPAYDLSNIAYSEYEKALALKFTITAYSTADFDVVLNITTDTAINDYDALSNYVKIALVTEKDTIENSADFNLSVDSYHSFVTVSDNSLTKKNTLTFNIDRSALQDMQFYIVLAYDEEVISFINDKYSSGELTELSGGEIICADDITYELLKVEEQ